MSLFKRQSKGKAGYQSATPGKYSASASYIVGALAGMVGDTIMDGGLCSRAEADR
jgi:hypothetical protein